MLRSTAMQWERAVIRERQALQDAKERGRADQKGKQSEGPVFPKNLDNPPKCGRRASERDRERERELKHFGSGRERFKPVGGPP